MSNRRRIAALLCALFLFVLSAGAVSHEGLLFLAAENMVLPLTKNDMPFFHEGYLYISSEFFTGAVRDALGVSSAKIGNGVLLYRGEQSLLFRGHYSYAQDSEQNTYAPGMILREDKAYVPAAVVARYFDLLYSTTDVEHGKLVWLRNPSFPMKDKAFAKAAASQLNTVYQEYLKSLETKAPPEPAPLEEPEEREHFSDFSAPESVTGLPTAPAPDEETNAESTPDKTPNPAPVLPDMNDDPAPPETSVSPSVSDSVTPPRKSVTPSRNAAASSAPDVQPVTPDNSAAPDVQSVTPDNSPAPDVQPVTPDNSPAPDVQPITPDNSPAPDVQPITPDDSAEPSPADSSPATRGEQTICLCLRANGDTAALLDALDRRHFRATVFCDKTFLAEQGDLLRRLTATGYRVGLYIPADTPASALAQLETCNLLLQRTTMEKTRLVFIDGGEEETRRAAQNAGFVCLRPDVDWGGAALRTSRQAADLLKLVSQRSKTVSVWLDGTISRSGLNAFLNDALELDDAFLPWTEAASR